MEEEEEEGSESMYSHRRLIEIPDLDLSGIWLTIGNVGDPGNANAGLDSWSRFCWARRYGLSHKMWLPYRSRRIIHHS